jgi:hypothetical protein
MGRGIDHPGSQPDGVATHVTAAIGHHVNLLLRELIALKVKTLGYGLNILGLSTHHNDHHHDHQLKYPVFHL